MFSQRLVTLFLAAIALVALTASPVMAGDGGCSMRAGSRLAICLGIGHDCTKLRDECKSIKNTKKKALCYCKHYTRAANCWGEGICCTEWPAHAKGAADVCKVAKAKKVNAKALAKAVKVAQTVVDIVCHNDCGTDIPCLNGEPAPRHPHGGNCQPRSNFRNGRCTGRTRCNYRARLRRDDEPLSEQWE